MRIAVDARPLAAPTTGIGRYTRALLEAWPDPAHTFLLYSHRAIPPLSPAIPHVVRHGRRSGRVSGTPFAQLNFGRWARQDDADLFWSPRHHLPLGLRHIPAVVTIHDLTWRCAPTTMRAGARIAERLLMPRAVGRAAAIVTDSEATRRDIVAWLPEAEPRVAVVPLAATVTPAAMASRSGSAGPAAGSPAGTGGAPGDVAPYMLFVGTIEPRKNLERVVQAFSRLHAEHRVEHRLVIVGNAGWKNGRVHAALANSAAAQLIEVRGQVSDDELARLYAGADFVVAPSLYEGFCLPLVEAFAFGKPVITSDHASMPEVAGDAGILVDPYSTGAIATAMYRLIVDRGHRDALACAAKDRSARYSWKAAAEQLSSVFAAVARRGG